MKTSLTVTAAKKAGTFHAALNITDDRAMEICELIGNNQGITLPQAIAKISTYMKSANELAYAMFHFGLFTGEEYAKEKLKDILSEQL